MTLKRATIHIFGDYYWLSWYLADMQQYRINFLYSTRLLKMVLHETSVPYFREPATEVIFITLYCAPFKFCRARLTKYRLWNILFATKPNPMQLHISDYRQWKPPPKTVHQHEILIMMGKNSGEPVCLPTPTKDWIVFYGGY